MKKPNTGELVDAFAEDLLAERSARPLIIIGASRIDHLLCETLRAFLQPKIASAKQQDELLEGDSPLATFSARIKICRRLSLIDEKMYHALEKLRKLRNLSAHSILFDAARSPVRDHLHELKREVVSGRPYQLTKKRYFGHEPLQVIEELQCLLLTLCVLLEVLRGKVQRTLGDGNALRVAAK